MNIFRRKNKFEFFIRNLFSSLKSFLYKKRKISKKKYFISQKLNIIRLRNLES